jgi:hypothetical protein
MTAILGLLSRYKSVVTIAFLIKKSDEQTKTDENREMHRNADFYAEVTLLKPMLKCGQDV